MAFLPGDEPQLPQYQIMRRHRAQLANNTETAFR